MLASANACFTRHLESEWDGSREVADLACEGRVDYLLVESTAEPRLGRRTVLTFRLLPPPQKN
jgi:hypothetical protein